MDLEHIWFNLKEVFRPPRIYKCKDGWLIIWYKYEWFWRFKE